MNSALAFSPADVVRRLFTQEGQCAEPSFNGAQYTGGAWPAFAGVIPASPDELVAVFNGTDVVDARTMRGNIMEHFGLQVRVRSGTFDTAQAFARALRKWMAESVLRTSVSGGPRLTKTYLLRNFAKFSPVMSLGMNIPNDKRFNFTFNMLAVIEEQ